MIDMDPEIAAAFNNSHMISSKWSLINIPYLIRFMNECLFDVAVNGRGVHTLKAGSKRRRTKADMQE